MITAFGAKIVLSEGKLGIKGAEALADEINRDNPNSYIIKYYSNLSNSKAH